MTSDAEICDVTASEQIMSDVTTREVTTSDATASDATASDADATTGDGCKGCSATVRLARGEVERIVADYLTANPSAAVLSEEAAAARLAVCGGCPDLTYGTTCRYCGCLVEVRARLAEKSCPAPAPRWVGAGG